MNSATANNSNEKTIAAPHCLALVHEMSEALEAIENYLEAAICLCETDSSAPKPTLVEVCRKGQAEIARTKTILSRIRDHLQQDEGDGARHVASDSTA